MNDAPLGLTLHNQINDGEYNSKLIALFIDYIPLTKQQINILKNKLLEFSNSEDLVDRVRYNNLKYHLTINEYR